MKTRCAERGLQIPTPAAAEHDEGSDEGSDGSSSDDGDDEGGDEGLPSNGHASKMALTGSSHTQKDELMKC